jgi:hypothetical protein
MITPEMLKSRFAFPAFTPEHLAALREAVRLMREESEKFKAKRKPRSQYPIDLFQAQMIYMEILAGNSNETISENPVLHVLMRTYWRLFMQGGEMQLLADDKPLAFKAWPLWIVKGLGFASQEHQRRLNARADRQGEPLVMAS